MQLKETIRLECGNELDYELIRLLVRIFSKTPNTSEILTTDGYECLKEFILEMKSIYSEIDLITPSISPELFTNYFGYHPLINVFISAIKKRIETDTLTFNEFLKGAAQLYLYQSRLDLVRKPLTTSSLQHELEGDQQIA